MIGFCSSRIRPRMVPRHRPTSRLASMDAPGPRRQPDALPRTSRDPSATLRPGRGARCRPAAASPACPAGAGNLGGVRACGNLVPCLTSLWRAAKKQASAARSRPAVTTMSAHSERSLRNSLSIRVALRAVRYPRCNGHGRARIIGLSRHPSI